MARTGQPSVAILGAGPVGLEAALYARRLDYPVTVYERGGVGEHLRAWGHVRLFTPFGMNSTPLGRATLKAEHPHGKLPADGEVLTGREHLAAYLDPLAASPLLRDSLRPGVTVVQVGRSGLLKEEDGEKRFRQPFCLLLRDSSGKESIEHADVVVDCTGCYGNPRHLGEGGIAAPGERAAAPRIAWGVEDVLCARREHYADRTTLVVGAGPSAATTVGLLASLAEKHGSTWIVWLARRPGSQPIRRVMHDPLRERDAVAARANMLATRGEGHVEFHPQAVVDHIESAGKDGFTVAATVAGRERSWQIDRLIGNVGYQPDSRIHGELQVDLCPATLAPANVAAALGKQPADGLPPAALGAAALRNREPGFFILGRKSFGRRSHFLMRTGFEQVRELFTLLAGKPGLDLYKQARA